jgi:hypothetical protein
MYTIYPYIIVLDSSLDVWRGSDNPVLIRIVRIFAPILDLPLTVFRSAHRSSVDTSLHNNNNNNNNNSNKTTTSKTTARESVQNAHLDGK